VPDAVVIGAGPNGLVAANLLADAGWEVVVLEARSEPGGAVKTAELTEPGFRSDVFSAFYPFAAASPVLRALELEAHGLRWCRSPAAFAHPTADGRCAAVFADVERTAASLDSYAAGDGDAWRRVYGRWQAVGDSLLEALLRPFPPLRAGGRLAAQLGPGELMRFVRFGLLPVRRLAEEEFAGAGGGNLLAGNALHADFMPEQPGSGLFGWLLSSLGQQLGFPVPEGGAGELTAALMRRLGARGVEVRCGAEATDVLLSGRRATGVRMRDGLSIQAPRGVIADVAAPTLYQDLVGSEHLPARMRDDLRRFQWDHATFKVDWALERPVPWTAQAAREAGTVHVAEGMDAMSRHAMQVVLRRLPDRPYLVFGQYSPVDATRMPPGREVAWAYTHIPHAVETDAGGELTGSWDDAEAGAFADRMEQEVERLAPGFRDSIRSRHILTPRGLEAANPSLVDGAIVGGTGQIHQQLVFRPIPGLGRAETPIDRLFLASDSAHPGGGVHGACGANAARAALARQRAATRPFAIAARIAARAIAST
jgi:phytoene dehydrogenase-like protein